MKNEAIGIAINGREVKIAHVFRDKNHRLAVDFLESATLSTDLEEEARKKATESGETPILNDVEDIFALKSSQEIKTGVGKEPGVRENVDVLYSLLRKFAAKRIKVAFNLPATRVSYQDLDTHLDYDKNVFKGSLKKKIEQWKQGFNSIDNVSVITRRDGTLCNVACETPQPPIIGLLEQLNSFFKGSLYLSLMDSNEVSLVNLARNSYNFANSVEINIIIEIEAEFSRIIFMRGDDLLSVSPIITEGFSHEINNIIFSKILYELDNQNINEIGNILLAGKGSTYTTKNYFEQKFPDVRIGFIISQPLAENLSTQFRREDLSDYAIPIALAWKLVDERSNHFIPTNLLSSDIIDRQRVLKLSLTSYLLLFLLGLSAFIMTWKITAKKLEVGTIRKQNTYLDERIRSTEKTVNKVLQIDDQISKLNKSMTLSDSLSQGADKLLSLLEKLNDTVSRIRSIWVDEVQNTPGGFLIKGMAIKRGNIPQLAEELGSAKIRKLMRSEIGNQKVFAFEMEVDWNQKNFPSRIRRTERPPVIPTVQPASLDKQMANSNPVGNKVSPGSNFTSPSTELNEPKLTEKSSTRFEATSPQRSTSLRKSSSDTKPSIAVNKPPQIDNGSINNDLGRKTTNQKQNDNFAYFTIMISAHAAKFSAEHDARIYRSKGFKTFITTFPGFSKNVPYWVCYGNFKTFSEAEQGLTELNNGIKGNYKIIGVADQNMPTIISSSAELEENKEMIKHANHTVEFSETQSQSEKFDDDTFSATTERQTDSNLTDGIEKPLTTGYYTIKVSAHAIKFSANQEVNDYKAKGMDSFVITFPNANRNIPYWVCVGNFMSHREAEERIEKLSQFLPKNYEIVHVNH